MAVFTLAGFSLALFYAAFWYGGVVPADWNVSLTAFGSFGLLFAVFRRNRPPVPPPRRTVLWLCAALSIPAFQLLPLPRGLIGLLSPARKEMLDAAAQVIPVPPRSPLSAVPSATFDELIKFASFLLVMLVLRQLALLLRSRVWWCAAPLIVLGFAQACLGIYQYYSGDGTARGTFVNRDHFAGLLEMILPFPIMLAVEILIRRLSQTASALLACGLFGAAAVMFMGVNHSLSRMGFMACTMSLFTIGLTAILTRAGIAWKRRVAVGIFGLITIAGFIFLPVDPLISRFGALPATSISEDDRFRLWRDTLPLIHDFPLFGCGLGAYESCFLRYKNVAPTLTANFAHNDYLQLAAEIGIPGFLLFLGLAILALRRIVSGLGSERRYLALACLGSFVAIGIHSFVDFGLHMPANAVTLAWILGLGAGASPRYLHKS